MWIHEHVGVDEFEKPKIVLVDFEERISSDLRPVSGEE